MERAAFIELYGKLNRTAMGADNQGFADSRKSSIRGEAGNVDRNTGWNSGAAA
jgi:hypothetical protein